MDSDRVILCPFCGKQVNRLTRFCVSCGRSFEILKGAERTEPLKAEGTSQQLDNAQQKTPCPKQLLKSEECQSSNDGPKQRHKAKDQKRVQINIGLMAPHGFDRTNLKPLRGKTFQLSVDPEVEASDLLKQAVQKMKVFDKDMQGGPYVLLYPDWSEVIHMPGSYRPFKLAEYKKQLGKPYCRITFFICLETHYEAAIDSSDSDSSDSDSSDSDFPSIASRSTAEFSRADNVVIEPQNQSTPKHNPEDDRSVHFGI